MSGTMNKGSLVKNPKSSGGGGSAKLPTIVTSSGSSLPSASGYQEGDTFLNTSDKKIYKAGTDFYELNTSLFPTLFSVSPSTVFDMQTGNFSGFGYVSVRQSTYWQPHGQNVFTVPFKTSNNITSRQEIVFISVNSDDTAEIFISNGGLYFKNTDNKMIDIEINKIYVIQLDISGSDHTSNRYISAVRIYKEDGTLIINFTPSQSVWSGYITFSLGFRGGRRQADSFFSGTILQKAGDFYLSYSSGKFVLPSSTLLWDSGTDITDKTEYADKTNGILYLYQDTELVQIPLIDLSNYKLKATTTTIDTASVTVSEIKANTNYVFSNNAITDITLSGCETSFEETTIEFATGSTAPTLTDNSGITWVDGSAPTLNASKSYIIVIFNKIGFVKEY